MRKYEFRGKEQNYGEWVFGDLTHDIIGLRLINTYINGFKIIPETVGEFTGLYDKNNKEVWEGDILRKNNYWDIYIVWDADNACFGYLCVDWVVTQGNPKRINKEYLSMSEIIGNIHDNLETIERRNNND